MKQNLSCKITPPSSHKNTSKAYIRKHMNNYHGKSLIGHRILSLVFKKPPICVGDLASRRTAEAATIAYAHKQNAHATVCHEQSRVAKGCFLTYLHPNTHKPTQTLLRLQGKNAEC